MNPEQMTDDNNGLPPSPGVATPQDNSNAGIPATTTTPATQTPATQTPPPANTDPNQSHGLGSMIGHAFKSLLGGNQTVYTRDEQGNMVPQQVKQPAGALWRNIIASSFLSGMANADQPSFARGLVGGVGSAVQRSEGLDKQARQNADQDFLARQKVAQEKREATRLDLEKLRVDFEGRRVGFEAERADREKENFSAQQAMNNLLKIKAAREIQGFGIEDHNNLAKTGAAFVQQYKDAGQLPVHRYTESQYNEALESDPAFKKFDWHPVENETFVDKDGKVNHQLVWEAYDPNVKTHLNQSSFDQFKNVGLTEITGENGKTLKLTPGMELTPKQNQFLQSQFSAKYPQFHQQQVDALNIQKENEAIKHLKAQTTLAYAAAKKAGTENAQLKRLNDMEDAWGAFDKAKAKLGVEAGFASLPSSQQSLVVDRLDPTFKETDAKVKDLAREENDLTKQYQNTISPDERTELKKKIEDVYSRRLNYEATASAINKLKQKLLNVVPAQPSQNSATNAPKPPVAGGAITPEAAKWFLVNNGGDKQKAMSAASAAGWGGGPAQTPGIVQSLTNFPDLDLEGRAGDLAEKAGNKLRDIIKPKKSSN